MTPSQTLALASILLAAIVGLFSLMLLASPDLGIAGFAGLAAAGWLSGQGVKLYRRSPGR